jgi:hypothetical protein
VPLGTRKLGLFCKGRWRQLVFQKTISGRAPWEILPFQLIVETEYFPS